MRAKGIRVRARVRTFFSMNLRGVSMSGGQINSRNWTELFVRKVRGILRDGLLLSAVALGTAAFLSGCSGLVSSANSTGNPPPTTLDVTNVQAASVTTSSSQVVWTTNVPANSSVDYGTTAAYGNSTPVDPTMATSHQVTISGLAAGTTYYFQVNSTDSKGNHGHGGNKFNTPGFSLSGTITPTTGGNGATVTLSGAASTSATGDNSGNYTFVGLPNGTYTIVPSHTGFTFSPSSQSMVVNGANVTAANFTANAAAVGPTITMQPANQTVTAGQTATFAVVAGGTAPLSYQWQKNGASIAGATAASYTTVATTTADSGSTFAVAVTNTAGTVTSAAATLTVSAAPVAPTITMQPANQAVTAGQTATFAVVAGGTAPLSYQWQKNWANITGATAASYTTPATTTADSGSTFAVVVTNTAGTVTSSTATLTVNAAATPVIQVRPINYGNDPVGTNLSQPLIIKNTGTATLTITQVTETGSPSFAVSGYSLPVNVTAGQQTTITSTFLPTATGPASGNISIVSNVPTSPTSVALSGTGIAATLTLGISPTAGLSFGNVTTGTSSSAQNVTITNTGNSSVAISQINLTGAGYSMTGGSAPVTLSPSQNITLVVRLSPTMT